MKRSTKIIIVVASIIAVVSVAVGAYYIYSSSSSGGGGDKPKPPKPDPTPPPEPVCEGDNVKWQKAYLSPPDGFTCGGLPNEDCEVKCCKSE